MTLVDQPSAAPSGGPQNDRPLILIVEDNEKNARLTVAMLDSSGYRTAVAEDGIVGVRLARELNPSLIITDLQMPGMDGLELTRTLKADAETAGMPIIAVTAHALAEHRQAALAAGCRAFLAKPFRYRTLLAEVEGAIANN